MNRHFSQRFTGNGPAGSSGDPVGAIAQASIQCVKALEQLLAQLGSAQANQLMRGPSGKPLAAAYVEGRRALVALDDAIEDGRKGA